ncbi:MAG: hypothetical protein ACI37T_07550 [Candidatus Gastranaerophilaceae bacterium]
MQKPEDNIIDIKPLINPQQKVDESFVMRTKYHSNPIFKKFLVINTKNNTRKFTISDLFD